MSDTTPECAACPKLLEAGALFPNAGAVRFCFECPQGYREARFSALVARIEGRRTAVHSCRKIGAGA